MPSRQISFVQIFLSSLAVTENLLKALQLIRFCERLGGVDVRWHFGGFEARWTRAALHRILYRLSLNDVPCVDCRAFLLIVTDINQVDEAATFAQLKAYADRTSVASAFLIPVHRVSVNLKATFVNVRQRVSLVVNVEIFLRYTERRRALFAV